MALFIVCHMHIVHFMPLVGNDPIYAALKQRGVELPRTESLKTTLDRVVPFWTASIAPRIIKGERLIIAAHGNSVSVW